MGIEHNFQTNKQLKIKNIEVSKRLPWINNKFSSLILLYDHREVSGAVGFP